MNQRGLASLNRKNEVNTMSEHANKVVLIGDGAVGSSYAFSVVVQGVADELVIIDLAKDKTVADAKDLNHGAPYGMSSIHVKAGDYVDCHDADIVVLTAGAAQKQGETRLQLVERNTKIIKGIVSDVMASGFDGIFIVASNPVDILTRVTQTVSGLPASRVIGSGTILDTARFKYALGQEFGVAPSSVEAMIMGEHGDSELAVWSQATIAGLPIEKLLENDSKRTHLKQKLFEETRDAAYEIIKVKGSTSYGIAMGLLEITKAILYNQNKVLMVSSKLNGAFGHDDVYIGVPTVVNRQGAAKVIETPLAEAEQTQFDHSVQVLQDTFKDIKALV